MSQSYFATIVPGLEGALADELKTFRTRKRQIVEGGVVFETTGVGFYQVMHNSRLANRIYLNVSTFRARDPQELYRKTKRIDWARLLEEGQPVHIDASTRQSWIYGSGAVTNRVSDGIESYWETQSASKSTRLRSPPVESLRILARLDENECTLRLDATGDLLHRRGWRLAIGKAPLRENRAAALLQLLGWTPGTPLLDPMCGSGTFLIEAARISANLPPRQWPKYDFHRWANFDAVRWYEMIESAKASPVEAPDETSSPTPIFFGNDRDEKALSHAEANAARGGVSEAIAWRCSDAAAISPPGEAPGMLIVNPPYGERLDRSEGAGQWTEKRLIERCAEVFGGWRIGILLPDSITPTHPNLEFQTLARFRNGGIPVTFWSCDIPK